MEKLKKLFAQAVRFSLVGVINTLLDFSIFSLLTLAPLFAAHYVYAQAISYSLGVACSLVLNKLWTFQQKEPMKPRQIAFFLLVNLAALGVSSGALNLYQLWGLAPMLAKILSVPFSLGVNFIGNKLFVFKD